MAVDTVVNPGDQVKWDKVRELAEKICELYDSKKVDNNRITDPHAKNRQEDSKLEGWSYLINDITTPFKPENIGSQAEQKFLMFEFVYPDSDYKAYLEGAKLPRLIAQYLVTRPPNPSDGEIPTYKIQDLCNEIQTDPLNIDNLLESPRHLIKKFWYHGYPYSKDASVAAEIYMLDDKCHVYRVAYAGKNANGNGNTNPNLIPGMGILPIANRDFMTTTEPWGGSENTALTLTGTTWESPHLLPESTLPGIDAPPHCCVEHIWPKLGEEGGGEKNTLYAVSTLKNYIGWADWRDSYQKPLPEHQLLARQNLDVGNLTKEDIPAGYFPCYLALGHRHDDIESYEKISSIYDVNPIYDRYQVWHIGEYISVRTVPMEFRANNELIACLRVPVSICVRIDTTSFQPAIRKRWYDMLYYSLRNIAGYKYKNEEETETAVVGVTWDSVAMTEFYNKFKLEEKCACDRWKYLGIGSTSFMEHDTELGLLGPFIAKPWEVGTNDKVNTAQTWQFRDVGVTEELDYDSVFFEPYFEYLLCMKQPDYADGGVGGFKNPEEGTGVCTLTHQCTHEIILPWDGGDENAQCSSDGGTYYSTHAYTLNVLYAVANYIDDYKLEEDKPRNLKETICGGCHAPAKAAEGETGITYSPGQDRKYFITYYCSCILLPNENSVYKICSDEVELNVPRYYETTDSDQVVQIDAPGNVYTLQDDGLSYGYNAYVWKAVDMGGGGTTGKQSPKDVHIRIARNNLLVDAASPTMGHLAEENVEDLNAEDGGLINEIAPPECLNEFAAPNTEEGSLAWLGYLKCVTEEIYMRVQHPGDESVLECNLTEIAGEDALLFTRGNGERVAGSIDIYIAPIATPEGEFGVRYIGSIWLRVKSVNSSVSVDTEEDEEALPSGCERVNDRPNDYGDSCVVAGKYDEELVSADGWDTPRPELCLDLLYGNGKWSAGKQTRVFDYVYTAGPDVLRYGLSELTIKLQKSGRVWGDGELVIDIKIPKDNFKINDTIPADQRQKFVILATRASNTYISDFLKSSSSASIDVTSGLPERTPKDDWAVNHAGACRYGQHIFSATFSNTQFKDL